MPHTDNTRSPGQEELGTGVSRRGLLRGAAGVGAAAGAGAVLTWAVPANAESADAHTDLSVLESPEPLVAQVRDAKSGEIVLFAGERQVTIHDRAMAAQLLAAVR